MSERDDTPLVPPHDASLAQRSRLRFLLLIVGACILLGALLGLTLGLSAQNGPPADPTAHALWLMRRYPLIDGHNDLPLQFRVRVLDDVPALDIAVAQPSLNTDIPRLKQGAVGGQFWSVYVGCEYASKDAVRATQEQVDAVYQMAAQWPYFALATTADQVEQLFKAKRLPSLMGIEGGHQIDSSLASLRSFFRAGVRYMTLTHNCNTPWSESCCDARAPPFPSPTGLTDFGVAVVAEMNRLGMLVDLSHVSVRVMHTVLDVSKSPVIFSHSSCYALCPNARNVPDAVLERLVANGGVIMVNFYPPFVTCTNNATIADVVRHIDHVVKTASVDNVGLGADYDGVTLWPQGLEDVSRYPALVAALIRAGYSDGDVAKIIGGNLLRVMRANEAVALSLQNAPWGTAVLNNIANDSCRTAYT